ncbi:MAG TPA: glycosyltransferase [Gemmatimonadetes bacterium]|nr:glycosyltransferase [Gemmatimonadota bacterium]
MSASDLSPAPRADVLFVTHCRAAYTRKSLPGLIKAVGGRGKIWIWHNGDHEEKDLDKQRRIEEAWQVVQEYRNHPTIAHIHHSKNNVRLIPAMRWIFSRSQAEFIAKVDDDAIVEEAWLKRMLDIHDYYPEAGVLGAWAFMPEDFDEDLAAHKIIDIGNGLRMLRNNWVGGCGFVARAEAIKSIGGFGWSESFSQVCYRLSKKGWVIGWPLPLIAQDHLDDPRSPNTLCLSTDDLKVMNPLSLSRTSGATLEDWTRQLICSARLVQECPLDVYPFEHGFARRMASRVLRHLVMLRTPHLSR